MIKDEKVKNKFKLTTIATMIMMTVGCGGGGSDNSSVSNNSQEVPPETNTPSNPTPPTTPPPSDPVPPTPEPPTTPPAPPTPDFDVSVEGSVTSDINENDNLAITYLTSGAQGNVLAEFEIIENINGEPIEDGSGENQGGFTKGSVEINGDAVELLIDVSEVTYINRGFTVNVVISDEEDRTKEFSHTINVSDVSGLESRDRYIETAGAINNWLNFEPSALLLERLQKLVSRYNSTSLPDVSNNVSELVSSDDVDGLLRLRNEVEIVTSSYIDGESDESIFSSSTMAILQGAQETFRPIANAINGYAVSTQGLVPTINFSGISSVGVSYSEEYEKLSSFIGNENLGLMSDNGEWLFFDEYSFLQDIVFTQDATCAIE